ncbi:hypothetical protein [Faecalicatena contorta]|uniref:Uncharacterized protein n=1 Tax=Faecalicatena contorta TaxID=39482 RepID=A0A315ZV12_9FIRM|nr:hypothetical protein [Faecalicatena contorta]PWJ49426.1 hypothetical protein A8805_107124 [Faecalicatena contorta]SUQ14670.1 hypothetical protein SAMN05216529_107124 [Faecalicatena contorta]
MSEHTLFANEETTEKPAESTVPSIDTETPVTLKESSAEPEKMPAAAEEIPVIPEEMPVIPEDESPSGNLFRFKRKDKEFSRDEWILSRIDKGELMEYLKLEQKRNEFLQGVKDTREKRILKAFELTISLAAVVAVVFLLKDNPTILISILYIVGIIIAFWLWKNPRDK